MERTILHCDMNNFYASVECMLNPELKGHPVAVCGSTADRHGIVLAKNYEAKKYNIQTGEVVWQAKQKCRDLIVVNPHYEHYIKYSKLARDIYNRYTDLVEPFGMDECWLDVTGSTHSFGNGYEIAEKIKETIKFELGLTISVGVSFNKIFAKLGSDMKKPDAITVIEKETFRDKIWQLPASDLLGVGRATTKKLNYYGIYTIKDLATTSKDFLNKVFGKNGILLWKYANGTENSLVKPNDFEIPIKSVGHGITTVRDLENNKDVWPVILELSQDIGTKLRKYEKYAAGIAIDVRNNELHHKTWQMQLPQQTNSSLYLAKKAYALFCKNYDWNCDIRSITVRAINLVSDNSPQQIDFFSETQNVDKMERLETVVDRLRERFGKDIIKNAVLCQDIGMKSMSSKLTMPTGLCR